LAAGLPSIALAQADPAFPVGYEARLAEARSLLLSTDLDLEQNYRFQLEKAMVLYYQASSLEPQAPEVWIRLGRLTEIRSLWAEDPLAMEDLMEQARGYFLKAAGLSYGQPPAPVQDPEQLTATDPFVSNLLWSGRLRRGEINLAELYRHYTFNDQNPRFEPGFWTDLRFLIHADDFNPVILATALTDFALTWSAMPVEIIPPGAGAHRLRKIDILFNWADTLLTVADYDSTGAVFDRFLTVYPLALKLPLNVSQIEQIIGRLDTAQSLAPGPLAREKLWQLKDSFFALSLKISPDPRVWEAWGLDYYRRADVQIDDRRWALLQAEAIKKLTKSLELSPQKDQAQFNWGRIIEDQSYLVSPYLAELPPLSQKTRYQKCLLEALSHYQKAQEILSRAVYLQSLARVTLYLSLEEPDPLKFPKRFQEAVSLSHQGILSSDGPNLWLTWARTCLDIKKDLPLEYRQFLLAEALSAFNRYLSADTAKIPDLIDMADRVWLMAAQYPDQQDQALGLLIEICRRLTQLAPKEPSYGFALGLSIYAQLAGRPAWPDDPAVTEDPAAKKAFLEVMSSFLESLEGLSLRPGSGQSPYPEGLPLHFMSPEVGQIFLHSPRATFQERLASSLNRPLGRFLAMARPKTLPPWYKYQLACFLRLAAASGYLPEEEQMAYWRYALSILQDAKSENSPLMGPILAEEGLIAAELNLLSPLAAKSLVAEAENLWQTAEKISPGSSHYARARWAGWQGDRENLEKSLNHPAAWEDELIWPNFNQAVNDPAFRPYRGEAFFKKAWFGYSR
jgi:tetratricopeptide (TPR) repeat protein